MVNYSDRLKAAMSLRIVNTPQLAAAMKVSYQAVKKVLDGKTSAFGSVNNLEAARYLSVDSEWLAAGASVVVQENLHGLPPATVEVQPVAAKGLSNLAIELAQTFDELTDRAARNRAYSAATNEIFKQAQQAQKAQEQQAHCASPIPAPSQFAREEARPA